MLKFTQQIEQLPRLMDAADLRHRVISQNLANVNTPGYRRLDVEFEKRLAQEMSRSGSSGPSSASPEIVQDDSTSMRADGNNVDVDREIGQLGKNAILFQMYSQLLKSQFDTMKRAVEAP